MRDRHATVPTPVRVSYVELRLTIMCVHTVIGAVTRSASLSTSNNGTTLKKSTNVTWMNTSKLASGYILSPRESISLSPPSLSMSRSILPLHQHSMSRTLRYGNRYHDIDDHIYVLPQQYPSAVDWHHRGGACRSVEDGRLKVSSDPNVFYPIRSDGSLTDSDGNAYSLNALGDIFPTQV